MAPDLLKEYRRIEEASLYLMKQNEPQKYGVYLRMLSIEEIEKLLACVLQEMRRRDAEHLKGDVLNNSKAALQRARIDD
jgi:uncharacterized small protein (DUF1192 family)